MLIPEQITLNEDSFIYKHTKIAFHSVESLMMQAEDIQHSYNFVKTHKSLHATLTIQVSDTAIGNRGVFQIKANRGFFTDFKNYEVQKRLVDALQNFYSLLSQKTFSHRLKRTLDTGDAIVAFRYGSYVFFKDGTIVKNGSFFSKIDTSSYEYFLSYATISIRKSTPLGKIFGELIGDKSIDIRANKDVVTALLFELYGLSF